MGIRRQKKNEEGLDPTSRLFDPRQRRSARSGLLEEHADIKLDFVQLQINYADWENDHHRIAQVLRSGACPRSACRLIMEPVKGGSLVKLPPQVDEILHEPDPRGIVWRRGRCVFALRLPGVIAVLSGMTTMDQVQDNLRTMKAAKPLTDEESAVIDRVRTRSPPFRTVPCTDCRYCMKDCPQGIHIPIIMDSLDIMAKFGDMHRAKENYVWNARQRSHQVRRMRHMRISLSAADRHHQPAQASDGALRVVGIERTGRCSSGCEGDSTERWPLNRRKRTV